MFDEKGFPAMLSLTAVGEAMLVLFVVAMLMTLAPQLLCDGPLSGQASQAADASYAAHVMVGPKQQLRSDGGEVGLEALLASLAEAKEPVLLQVDPAVDVRFHYRVRYALRKKGPGYVEMPPASDS